MSVSDEFLQLAKRCAVDYVVNENVLAIIVAGSVARGTADRSSDVDILVFLNKPFTRDDFTAECKRATDSGGRVYGGSPVEFALFRYVDGVRCDICFELVATMDRRLKQVLEEFCFDENKQLMIRSIRESEILYGAELIDRWRHASDKFPTGLAEAIIDAHIMITPRWILERMGAKRGERLFLYDAFVSNVKRLLAWSSVAHAGYGLIEYAYYKMALAAGIEMEECRLLEENGRSHWGLSTGCGL